MLITTTATFIDLYKIAALFGIMFLYSFVGTRIQLEHTFMFNFILAPLPYIGPFTLYLHIYLIFAHPYYISTSNLYLQVYLTSANKFFICIYMTHQHQHLSQWQDFGISKRTIRDLWIGG